MMDDVLALEYEVITHDRQNYQGTIRKLNQEGFVVLELNSSGKTVLIPREQIVLMRETNDRS